MSITADSLAGNQAVVTIKWKNEATCHRWAEFPLSELIGLSFVEIAAKFDSQEVVAEIEFLDRKFYFCGTEALAVKCREKGFSASSFNEALSKLKINCNGLPPIVDEAVEVMGGEVVGWSSSTRGRA